MYFQRAPRDDLPSDERGDTRTLLDRWRLIVLALVVVGVVLVATGWSWIDAQARAVVVVSSVLETPILTPAVEAATEEPVVEDTVFAGRPALVARPEGEGPWPALLFVNGVVREGRNYPPVQNLDRGHPRAPDRRKSGGKRTRLGRRRYRPVHRHPDRPQHCYHRALLGWRGVRPV